MKDKNERREFWLFVLEVAIFLVAGTVIYILMRRLFHPL